MISTGNVMRGNSSRKPLVGAHKRGHGHRRLHLARDQGIAVERLHGFRIA